MARTQLEANAEKSGSLFIDNLFLRWISISVTAGMGGVLAGWFYISNGALDIHNNFHSLSALVWGFMVLVGGYFFPRLVAFPGALVMLFPVAIFMPTPEKDENDFRHLRGVRVVKGSKLADKTRDGDGCEQMYWGALPIPRSAEITGFLLVGAPGSGKSVAIHEGMMPVISRRGDGCFISDRSGLFVSRYFDAAGGDRILNPLDDRGVAWSPLAEIQQPWDTKTIAKSLVPDRAGEGGEWSRYAQNLVAAILLYCWTQGKTNSDVYRLAVIADQEELVEVVAGTAAAPYLSPGNERMLGSIRGVAGEALASLEYLRPTAGRDGFSIRQYVLKRGPEKRGRLFFPYLPDQRLALQSLVSACADVFATAVMMLPESRDENRYFLIMDELSSLAKVATLEEFLTNGRKHGGAAILGVQNIAQMYERYGKDTTQTMVSSISSWLILCTGRDEGTAEYMSKSIGDRQISRTVKSEGGNREHRTWNESEQVVIERAVLPSEIQALPPLRGYARLAGHPVARVQLTPNDSPLMAEAFVPWKGDAPAEVEAVAAAEPTPTPTIPRERRIPTGNADLDELDL